MSDEREVRADAIQVFLEPGGIRIHFGRDVTPDGSDTDVLETVAKVVLTPHAFRRLGMSLPEALRRLPRERPPAGAAAAPPAFAAPPKPTPTAPSRGAVSPAPSMPSISFIGSAETPTSPGTTPAAERPPGAHAPVRAGTLPADDTPAPAAKPPLEALLDPTVDMPSSRAPAPPSSEHAKRLLEVIAALGAPHVRERSFRMRAGELLPNRFLVSVGRPQDGSASDERLARAFAEIGLPAPFLEATQKDLPGARCVHFGFEGDGDSPLLKVYLEIGGDEHIETKDAGSDATSAGDEAGAYPEPVLEHVAYKWDPTGDGSGVVGRYWWYPHMTAEQIRTRVADIYGGAEAEAQDIAFEVVALAAARMPERDIHYLEIEEEGNPRRSYSINFYDADLKVRDLHPMLSRMRRLFDVQPARFQVLYDQIKKRRFGHLAGGVHRNGKGFFNVYYGPQFFDTDAPPGPWRGALQRTGLASAER